MKLKPNALSVGFVLTLPLVVVYLLNPSIIFLGDGWWYAGIIETFSYPPQNPWFYGEPLLYPYLLLGFLSFFRSLASAWVMLPLASVVIQFGSVIAVFALSKEILRTDRLAAFSTFSFFVFSSVLSGAAVVFDMLVKNLGFLEFLKSVHGPNYYVGMKFVGGESIAIPHPFFMSLLPGLSILSITLSFYCLVRKRYWLNAVALAVLTGSNPVLGIFGCLAASLYLLKQRGLKALPVLVGTAVIVLLVNIDYILSMLGRNAVRTDLLANMVLGLATLVIFCIGFAPQIIGYCKTRTRAFLPVAVAASCVLVCLFVKFGYLYATVPVFLVASIYSAKWVVSLDRKVLVPLVVLSSLPFILSIAAYSAYHVEIDKDKVQWAMGLSETTSPDQPVFECFGDEERWVRVYAPAFGGRVVYIADKRSVISYGVDEKLYEERLAQYYEHCGTSGVE